MKSAFQKQTFLHPTSNAYREWRNNVIEVLLGDGKIKNTLVKSVALVLDALDQNRLAYRGQKAFMTIRAKGEDIAAQAYLGKRQFRRIIKILEDEGFIQVQRTKVKWNMNLYNRYILSGFKAWFSTFSQACGQSCHAKERENELSSLSTRKSNVRFPKTPINSWDQSSKFWKVLGQETLRDGEQLPCISKTSIAFRKNLMKHGLSLDDPSIIPRWKAFVRRAIDFKKKR